MNEQEIISRFKAIERRLNELEEKTKKSLAKNPIKKDRWYKEGSTIHKILILVEENFFDKPQTISEIINKLKSKDYHLKAQDLTLPLRKIVRKGILKKTKERKDGTKSKKWMYTRE